MNIIKPEIHLEAITCPVDSAGNIVAGQDALNVIERAGRTCYKSEGKITETSKEKFCQMIQSRNHMSVLEHASATFRVITSRGVTHEQVRHRLASYSQESTRYCSYTPDKKGMVFMTPAWILKEPVAYTKLSLAGVCPPVQKYSIYTLKSYTKEEIAEDPQLDNLSKQLYLWLKSCEDDEWYYNKLIELGQTPQQARDVLPNCLKTEIVMTANFREWLHFLNLRTSSGAHPDMIIIAKAIGNKLHQLFPVIFSKQYE